MEYVKVGTVSKTRGLKGEVRIYSTSDFRDLRFATGNTLYLYSHETGSHMPLTVKSHTNDGPFDLVRFAEIEDINQAEKIVGMEIQAVKDHADLPDGAFFHDELIGMKVLVDDQIIGEVGQIEEYAAYKTLRIKRSGQKDLLVPFVPAFIAKIDATQREITINPLKGLL